MAKRSLCEVKKATCPDICVMMQSAYGQIRKLVVIERRSVVRPEHVQADHAGCNCSQEILTIEHDVGLCKQWS